MDTQAEIAKLTPFKNWLFDNKRRALTVLGIGMVLGAIALKVLGKLL